MSVPGPTDSIMSVLGAIDSIVYLKSYYANCYGHSNGLNTKGEIQSSYSHNGPAQSKNQNMFVRILHITTLISIVDIILVRRKSQQFNHILRAGRLTFICLWSSLYF